MIGLMLILVATPLVCGERPAACAGRPADGGERPTVSGTQPTTSSGDTYARLEVALSPEGPRLGANGPLLVGEVFYDILGEKELAAEYRANRRFRELLALGGSHTMGTGSPLLLVGLLGLFCGRIEATCSPIFDVMALGGGALLVGGSIAVGVATQLDPEVRSPAEREELARRYNARLREQLGIGAVQLPTGVQLHLAF